MIPTAYTFTGHPMSWAEIGALLGIVAAVMLAASILNGVRAGKVRKYIHVMRYWLEHPRLRETYCPCCGTLAYNPLCTHCVNRTDQY